ncbi:hypothetical protein [Couchioplanes caeruleus]|uniref:Uncharacterized protein n=2 Tax=Couchioplanes caeruleus TaxID=56438 RepID=A0A1K0FP10_9ACTN|nr:hypothetical protein [Couchioplanes caeruleus]OJF14529.1 hypothetical protein BG844_09350 [Couchioplanes caeruleus subsp. caeruleus]
MAAAGVTEAGIAVVEAVADLIDGRWQTRQALLDALGAEARQAGLDRRRLSKELGGKDKPKGPEWHITVMIARRCVDDPGEWDRTLARLAGLWCAARGVQRPPGYDGPITSPGGPGRGNEGATAMRQALDTVQQALNDKVNSLEKARLLLEGAYRKLAEQQAFIDQQQSKIRSLVDRLDATKGQSEAWAKEVQALSAQIDTLTAQALGRDAEIAQVYKRHQGAELQLAILERENTRLSQEVMSRSAREIQLCAELEEARRALAVHALHRHDNLRERCARLAAQMERFTDPQAPVFHAERHDWFRLSIDTGACVCRRALAAYLLVHQEHCGRSVAQIAADLEVPHTQMEQLLTGQALPGQWQMGALVRALGAESSHAWQLYNDVAGCCPPAPVPDTDANDPSGIDLYESIVSRYNSDSGARADHGQPPSTAAVAESLGDTATARTARDTAANSTASRSPTTGDTTVAIPGDLPMLVRRDRATAVYRAGSHAGSATATPHRHAISLCRVLDWAGSGAVILAGGVPMLAVLVGAGPETDLTSWYVVAAAVCLACASLALVIHVVLRRHRRRYRARHSPGACAPLAEPAEPATARVVAPGASHDYYPYPYRPVDPVGLGAAEGGDEPTLLSLPVEPIEADLRARGQQMAQALAGRQGPGIRRTATPAADQEEGASGDTAGT